MKAATSHRLIGCLTVLTLTAPSQASTFYDNLTGGTAPVQMRTIGAGPGLFGYNDPAYGFTSLVTGQIDKIELGLVFSVGSSFEMQLTTSQSSSTILGTGQGPATVLGSWTLSYPGTTNSTIVTLNNITGINLSQGTSYWLHAVPITGTSFWSDNTRIALGPLYQCAGGYNATPCTTHTSSAAATTGMIRITGPNASPVPEPGSWAMMIVGFGMSGHQMRRRRGRSLRMRATA